MLTKYKTTSRVVLIPVSRISPNPNQPRLLFDQEKLDELAMSISQYGLLQPITVQLAGKNQYQLIAGERRLMACKKLKMHEIPAVIMELKREDSAALALIENIQRCDLNYFEEARAIDRLIHLMGETQQSIAKRLGKNQSTVANKLRLLRFSEEIQNKMMQMNLTERHARALLPLSGHEQLGEVIRQIGEKNWTVAQTERYIQKLIQKNDAPRPTKRFIVKDLKIFMNTIEKAADTMKLSGIDARTEIEEDEEEVIYTIRIPRQSAYEERSVSEKNSEARV